ncbi:MAG: amidase [Ilumatobacter sp.]|uniref:amidase n=1 Tax=Ilumatobacter sp. TaxID=1967498 RepID=UPI00391B9A2A
MRRIGATRRAWETDGELVSLVPTARTTRVVEVDAQPSRLRLDLARTAVVIVDMQNDFCHPDGWLGSIEVDVTPARSPIDALVSSLPAMRAGGAAVVWLNWGTRPDRANLPPNVVHVYDPDGRGVGIGSSEPTGHPVLQTGSWGAALIDELVVQPGDIEVDKHRMSGFWDTELDSVLRNLDVSTLLFAGVNADQCVLATLIDAACIGYDVVMLDDACATTSPSYCWDATVYNVRQCFGFTASLADIATATLVPIDTVGAFVGTPAVLERGASTGPLAGLALGVKDLFDVAGTVTRAGTPDFGRDRSPATSSASAVTRLVDAGATVVGRTVTDELAFSLSGTNVHDGTPVNVAAPGRVPGGSSAGSAAAVAAGLVDLALGTDTGGSIRVPASYCGLHGWRPTHGAVPIDGVVALAASFDTVGLFARDPAVLLAGARALLGASDEPAAPPGVSDFRLVAEVLADVRAEVADELRRVGRSIGAHESPIALGVDLAEAVAAFRAIQGDEAWAAHGEWITETRPNLGPGIAARFAGASQVTAADVTAGLVIREQVERAIVEATSDGRILVVPAAAGAAPPADIGADRERHETNRMQTLRIESLAGLAGAPVVVRPLATDDGFPLGIAFIGAPGSDLQLLRATVFDATGLDTPPSGAFVRDGAVRDRTAP